jgi:hypothetical protein
VQPRSQLGKLMTNFPPSTPILPQKCVGHKRSLSESALYITPKTPKWSTATRRDRTSAKCQNATVSRGQSASVPDASREKTTPQRPPRPPYGLCGLSPPSTPVVGRISSQPLTNLVQDLVSHPSDEYTTSNAPKPQRSNFNSSSPRIAPPPHPMAGPPARAAIAPSPMSPVSLCIKAGSAVPSTNDYPSQVPPPLERNLGPTSDPNVPFVIGMGSSYNPTLITPSTALMPTVCSITRNAPLKIIPFTPQAGVSGTMASSTTVSSPCSHPDVAGLVPPPRPMSTKPTQLTPIAAVRKTSLRSQDRAKWVSSPPRTPSDSRSVSGSSTRTAIRLPRAYD